MKYTKLASVITLYFSVLAAAETAETEECVDADPPVPGKLTCT